jgi:hypothetical protein
MRASIAAFAALEALLALLLVRFFRAGAALASPSGVGLAGPASSAVWMSGESSFIARF